MVIATGDNQDMSCEVTSWKDIIDVACGDFHTVGLRKDSTVVACGAKNFHKIYLTRLMPIVASVM